MATFLFFPNVVMTQSRQELLAELERARKRVEKLERKLEHDESMSEERDELSRDEFLQFGRQMILPSVGLPGAFDVRSTSLHDDSKYY